MRSIHILVALPVFLLAGVCTAEISPEWTEGFEGDGSAFELQRYEGAEGSAAVVTDLHRSGKCALRITKTNALGYLVVRVRPKMEWKAGVKYRVGGYFHSRDARPANLLLFRTETAGQEVLQYDAIDTSRGYQSQSLLPNAPVGLWDRRVGHRQLETPDDQSLSIVLLGPPCSVWLDDLFVTSRRFRSRPAPKNVPEIRYTHQQVRDIFAHRSDVQSRIEKINGRATWTLNGQAIVPCFYKPPHSGVPLAYVDAFDQASVPVFCIVMPIGPFAKNPPIWTGPGQVDLKRIDHYLGEFFARNPNGYALLNFLIRPYKGWGNDFPQECLQDAQGRRAYTRWANVEGFASDEKDLMRLTGKRYFHSDWVPSHHSRLYHDQTSDVLKQVTRYVMSSPYRKAIVGAFLSGGHDIQFQVHRGQYDYSPAAQQGFRAFCRNEYQTIERLNSAWGSEYASFDEVRVPDNPRHKNDKEVLRPILPRGPHSDYMQFRILATWAERDRYAQAIKEAADKDIVVFSYANPADGYRNGPLMQARSLDGSGSITHYAFRRPGLAPGYALESTIRPRPGGAGPKMHFSELDLRSWVAPGYDDEVKQAWISSGQTPEQWRNIARKLVARSLIHENGFWWFSIRHFFRDRLVLNELSKIMSVARRLWQRPPAAFRPDVCIVRSSRAPAHFGSRLPANSYLEYMQLETSGVPYQMHDLADVLSNEQLQDFKFYAFLDCCWMSKDDRRIICEKLQRDGRMLIWVGPSGYVDETGLHIEAMRALTALPMATKPQYGRARAYLGGPDTQWPGDMLPIGAGEQTLASLRIRGANPWIARSQLFWIEEQPGEQSSFNVLGRYVETGKPAVAVRKLDTWTSVAIGPRMGLSAELLHHLARQAGAFIAGEPGPYVLINDRFCSIHGMRAGPYTLHLPPGCTRLIEADTGRVVSDGSPTVELQLHPHRTDWYFVESAETPKSETK